MLPRALLRARGIRALVAVALTLALAVVLVPGAPARAEPASTGRISGVIQVTPAPIADLNRTAILIDENSDYVDWVDTDALGRYSFEDVEPGAYTVWLGASQPTMPARGYAAVYWPAASHVGAATPIEVVAGADIAGISATLRGTSTVRGVFGPGVIGHSSPAVAYYPASWGTGMPDFTSPEIIWAPADEGWYEVTLPPGSYRVAFGDRVDVPVPRSWDLEDAVLRPGIVTVGSWEWVTVNGAGVPAYTDVPARSQFSLEISWLASNGITTGYPDGSFHPIEPVTRAAMAAFLYRYAGKPSFEAPARQFFWDVPLSHPFYKEIMWLYFEGISTGYGDFTFRPDAPVARDAMAAFLYRFAGRPTWQHQSWAEFTDVQPSSSFANEIDWLASRGIATGYDDGTFRPLASVNRDAMAAFLFRYWRSI